MWWEICLALSFGAWLTEARQSPSPEEFEALLQEAAYEVFEQHRHEMETSYSTDTPPPFMRSFVPDTGVGNREELIIESISPIPVFDDFSFTQFRYMRFNNTDYILGVSRNNVILVRTDTTSTDHFQFSVHDAVFSFAVDYPSTVTDVALFTRFQKHSEMLYVAILTENDKTSLVNIYEIVGDKEVLVALIHLGQSPAKKIAYVQSLYGGSLVVLMNSDRSDLVYRQEGSSELNHYIEVHHPAAVDLVTFTVHGHGYIAVANFTTCEVYKMDEFVRNHLQFDRLFPQSSDILDLEYFRLGFHHYLAVTGETTQYLYVWNSGLFSLKQTLTVPGVRQIYASILQTCRDDVILLVIKDRGVDLYVYGGEKETFIRSDAAVPDELIIKPESIGSYAYRSKAVIMFADDRDSLQVYGIQTKLESVPNPVFAASSKVYQQMKEIQVMLESQTKEVEQIKSVLLRAVRANGDQRISAIQIFDDLQATGGVSVPRVEKPVIVEWEGSSLTLEEYRAGTDALEKEVDELEKIVSEIENMIPDIVRIDEDAIITGRKSFTGDVSGSSLHSVSLNLNTVADLHMPTLQKELYRLDRPQRIRGSLTFERPLTVTGNLDVEGTINGIDFSREVMTTNTAQTSKDPMTFLNKVVIEGDLDLSGKINGIDIGDEVVTLSGNRHISGHKSFLNGITATDVETKLLDGVDINDMFSRAFTVKGDQVVPGHKTFTGGLHTNNIQLRGTLNGYNVSELAENIVRVDKPAIISGHKTFLDDVTVKDELFVEGTINGIRIPDDLFLTDVDQIVTGTKEFKGRVTAHDVTVTGRVDGLKIPEDIVTLSRDEEISSTFYFSDGINVMKDIIVEGLVDDVDISELAKVALKMNETREFKNAVFHGPVLITEDLEVGGLVNKVNIEELVKDIVFRDEPPIVIESEKNFTKVVADTVKLENMINGYNIEVDFMRVDGDQVINGTKTFTKHVTFNSVTIEDGAIGGVSIDELYENRITLALQDEMEHDIKFADHVIVEGDLTLHGTLSGLRIPGDIVLRNSSESISNKDFNGRVTAKKVIVDGDVEVSGRFGGVDLTEFFHDRVTLSEDQEIVGRLTLADTTAGSVRISGDVNGMNISEFASNIMSKTMDQTVTADKTFAGKVTVHGPVTTEGVNGVDLREIKRRAFKLLEDNVVTERMTFEGALVIEDLTVQGEVNGVNITRLAKDSLKKEGAQFVTGFNVFSAGIHVEGNIEADKVNNLFIPTDVLLKTTPQTITGQFTVGSLGIEGDLKVNGLVNGLDLSEMAPKLARTDQDSVIESNVTFMGPVHVYNDIEVTGSINDIDLKQLQETVLMKTGDQTITGHKTIRGNVTVLGDIGVGSVNGKDLKQFLQDVVRIDIPQTISATKSFAGDVNVEEKVFVGGDATVLRVNARALEKFIDKVVFVDVPANITGPLVFKESVEVQGDLNADLINGLRLKTDVVTIACNEEGPQVITGEKTFWDLTVLGDIVTEKVNSYDLMELFEDTLLIEGNQTVLGKKRIMSDVVFKKNVYPDEVNGLVPRRDLVTLGTDQTLSGPLVFDGDVLTGKDLKVKGMVNGVDLKTLQEQAVYLGTDQSIEGTYTFEHAVVASDVVVEGTVNGIDLPALYQNVSSFWDEAETTLTKMHQLTEDSCELAEAVQELLKDSYHVLDGFAFHQELSFPASFIQRKSSTEISLVQLDELDGASIVDSDWRHQRFVPRRPRQTKYTSSIVRKVGHLQIGVHVGLYANDSSVTINGAPLNMEGGFIDVSVMARQDEVVVALLYPLRGVCDVYSVTPSYSMLDHFPESYGQIAVGKDSASIALFEISGMLHLAVASHDLSFSRKSFSKVFVRSSDIWQRVQKIPVLSSKYVKHFLYHSYHYLAFTNTAPVYETREPKSIQIYRNSGPNEMLFNLFQKIPFDDAKGMEVFEFGGLSELYMAAWNETQIQIFRLEGESGMRPTSTIHGRCIKDVKPLLIGQDVYLAVGQQNLQTDEIINSVVYKGLTKGIPYSPHNFTYC